MHLFVIATKIRAETHMRDPVSKLAYEEDEIPALESRKYPRCACMDFRKRDFWTSFVRASTQLLSLCPLDVTARHSDDAIYHSIMVSYCGFIT